MAKKTIIVKFGGTSVGTSSAMAQTIEVVKNTRASWERTVVVISALSGVTNILLDSAHHAAAGDFTDLFECATIFTAQSWSDRGEIIRDANQREAVKEELEGLPSFRKFMQSH